MVVSRSAGKAVVELDLDDKQFKSKTGQATAGLESNMKSLGTTVLGVVSALGLLAAAKGAVNMLTSLAKKAIEVADSFEVMEKQLITLTKSEDKAKAFFKEIKDFARDTPYQVRDLAQSFNMLYPIFKDKTIPMMKVIGDTAAGTGRSFEDTASAMMRMATGDWGVEIMRQLFLVKADFGDMFGPNGELVASQEEAFNKLQEILGERFGGMMVGMMDTVRGKVSNLKDVLDSLANSVGVELTPITKEFLDVLIETVKQAEETEELKDAARELAGALAENKDTIFEIIGLLPEMISLLAEVVRALAEAVDTMADLNKAWGDWTGSGMTAVEELAAGIRAVTYALAGSVAMFTVIKEKRGAVTTADLDAALREVEMRMRGQKAGARTDIFWGPLPAEEEEMRFGGKPPTKGKKPLTYEQRLAAARGRLADLYRRPGYEVEQRGLTPEEMRKQQEEEQKKQMEHLQRMAEFYADYLDPSSYLIEGLKSGDVKKAIEDFAVTLGTRVAEELAHKLIVMGIVAILNLITGGGAQGATMVMGRGGVIRAAQGLVGMLPPRPGGWYIPFGDKMINAAEAGQPEAMAILPPGRRGQDIILNQLAPMFNLRPQLQANVESRPQITTNIKVEHADRHHIRAHNESKAGKVNKAVSVRS